MPVTPSAPSLSYNVAGPADAPWVVLIGGLGSVQAGWLLQVRDLSVRFRVLTYDHRGLGASEAGPGDLSIWDYAVDAVRVLDAAGVDAAGFVGLSFGGRVVQALALDWPARVRAIAIGGTSCGGLGRGEGAGDWSALHAGALADPDAEAERWERVLLPLFFGPRYRARYPERMHHLARWRARHPSNPIALETQWKAGLGFDVCGRLGEIRCPALILHGEDDALAPVYQARRLAEGIPGARLQLLDGVGHSPNAEDPERFNAALMAFFSEEP